MSKTGFIKKGWEYCQGHYCSQVDKYMRQIVKTECLCAQCYEYDFFGDKTPKNIISTEITSRVAALALELAYPPPPPEICEKKCRESVRRYKHRLSISQIVGVRRGSYTCISVCDEYHIYADLQKIIVRCDCGKEVIRCLKTFRDTDLVCIKCKSIARKALNPK